MLVVLEWLLFIDWEMYLASILALVFCPFSEPKLKPHQIIKCYRLWSVANSIATIQTPQPKWRKLNAHICMAYKIGANYSIIDRLIWILKCWVVNIFWKYAPTINVNNVNKNCFLTQTDPFKPHRFKSPCGFPRHMAEKNENRFENQMKST